MPPVIEEWVAAFNSGDTDRLLALHTDDALRSGRPLRST
jgi:ketosteroid isomerase-like protein